MIGLPDMIYADGIRKRQVVAFGGYNHTLGAGEGELWDMKNLTGDHYPVLASRAPRWRLTQLTGPNGFYTHDGLYWVDGDGFYAAGARKGTVENSRKTFASLGAFIIILPDKAYYNRLTDEFGSLEASYSCASGLTFGDGTYAGEEAELNSITTTGDPFPFKVGDAVTISGCSVEAHNTTIIIREISEDGKTLRFYENSFTKAVTESSAATLKRTVPDMDFLCENENRLWGCKGDTIYASKLGDIFNWNVFDGISTDSFAVDVGSAGDFTGCCSYLGYPCFFKEEHIYKVYGDKPSNFQVMGSASLGVEQGSAGSLAIAGETLFYLSRTGIVAYSGGIPQSVAAPFGTERYRNAVGGSDGIKYYVSMQDVSGDWALFVYDTRTGLWHKEDALRVVGFGWDTELYFLDASGVLWLSGNARTVPENAEKEAAVESMAEFGDFVEGDPNKKGTSKLQVRMELEAGASVTVSMQFDSDGVWRQVKTLTAAKKRSYYLPIIPRRSDHFRIRFTGVGQWRLYSLARENYSGSEQ